MKQVLKKIKELKNSDIKTVVETRLSEFEQIGRGNDSQIFLELCFCLMTANFQAEKSIQIQKEIGKGFLTLSETQLAKKLKELGHRFPNTRAKYIFEARKYLKVIKKKLLEFDSEIDARDWIRQNVKGVGMKESSHFLRNIGYKNLAILDFHIIDLLEREELIKRPKTITPKNYLVIESVLLRLGEKSKLNMAELDLYLWFLETGKVLK
ncbi:N-glycosylase/DNA lyase [Candidatus Woesearchaeota archaeon]|jgi:N-glycosylase/DNA lyase|nr:N-glycosylase/DNA lyase [Candidatus Woesearchaeota archaeon]